MTSGSQVSTIEGVAATPHVATTAGDAGDATKGIPVVLATKLYPPAPRLRLVQRPRLMARLDESLTRKLTLISAPAGFGKTTLLSEWRTRTGEGCGCTVPLAWVSLDEADSDPVRFWSNVIAALETLPIKGMEQAKALLQSPGQMVGALTALINAVAQTVDMPHCVLALDDFHVIHADAVNGSLDFLIEHLPPSLHMVLLSRADPSLPLARLRARDELVELRAADLRCTRDEIEAYFNRVMGLALGERSLDAIATYTEGWLTGMRLLAMSLQHWTPEQAADFISGFTGVHQHVLAYLTEEVLQRQPECTRDFLIRTSVLRRLCGPLCDALTGRADGQSLLAQLNHDNVFTESLDDIGEWYHYHRLFADVLLAELQQKQPGLLPELHARAADWLEANGQLHEAVRHAFAAGMHDWVADAIERHYRKLVFRGELSTVRDWIDALPSDVLSQRPRIQLAHAWASVYSGRYDTIECYLQQADAAMANVAPEARKSIRGELLALRAVIHSVQGESRRSIQEAEEAFTLMPASDTESRLIAYQALGNGKRLLGQLRDAEAAYRTGLALGEATGAVMAKIAVRLRLGQTLMQQGKLREAAAYFEQSMRVASDYGNEPRQLAGESYIRLGDVMREWNRLSDAQQHITQGIELAERANNAPALLTGYFTLMRLRTAQGQPDEAREALRLARQLAARYDFPHLDERVEVHEAWLAWAEGDFARLAIWVEPYAATNQAHTDGGDVSTDLQDVLLFRSELQQSRFDDAECTLLRIQRSAQAAGRGWTVMQTHVQAALLAHAGHHRRHALTSLEQALTLSEPEGFVRLFLDEGAPMQTLLADVRANTSAPNLAAYAGRLLHLLRAPQKTSHSSERLVEPLSARELEVLQLMATGASNQDIAANLIIAQGTVKAHIHHIFGKLGATSRIAAVSCARSFGLVEIERE